MATTYTGSVDLISGLRPKNGGSFPLIEASDVLYASGDVRLNTLLNGFTSETGSIKTYVDNAISAETSARSSADSTLSDRVTTLESAVGSGGSVATQISTAVNTEQTRAQGVESDLDDRVSDLETAVGTGGTVDSKISSAVNTEQTRAAAAESALSSRVTAVETAANTTLPNLISQTNSKLTTESTTRAEADESLGNRVSALENSVGTGGTVDSKISSAVNTEKTRAQGVESALSSRVTSLESAVGTGGTVDSKISSAVNTESTTRAEADESLGNRVSALENSVGTGGTVDSKISNAVSTESTTRAEADENLGNRISALETSVGTGGSVATQISTAVNTEKTRAQGVESGLGNRISALETSVGTVDSKISNAVSTESTTRAEADENLGNRVSALETSVGAVDSKISNAVSTEQTRAAAAESALSSRVTAVETAANTTLPNLISRTNSKLTTEQTRAATAESALSSRVTAVATAANTTLPNLISQTNSKLTTESTTRAEADESLDNRVSALESQVDALEGNMLVVSGTAAMTDTTKIYINSANNCWYYYNASTNAWVNGGKTAGVSIDSLLKTQGAAADAKAVGDAISELSSDLEDANYILSNFHINKFNDKFKYFSAKPVYYASTNTIKIGYASTYSAWLYPADEFKKIKFDSLTLYADTTTTCCIAFFADTIPYNIDGVSSIGHIKATAAGANTYRYLAIMKAMPNTAKYVLICNYDTAGNYSINNGLLITDINHTDTSEYNICTLEEYKPQFAHHGLNNTISSNTGNVSCTYENLRSISPVFVNLKYIAIEGGILVQNSVNGIDTINYVCYDKDFRYITGAPFFDRNYVTIPSNAKYTFIVVCGRKIITEQDLDAIDLTNVKLYFRAPTERTTGDTNLITLRDLTSFFGPNIIKPNTCILNSGYTGSHTRFFATDFIPIKYFKAIYDFEFNSFSLYYYDANKNPIGTNFRTGRVTDTSTSIAYYNNVVLEDNISECEFENVVYFKICVADKTSQNNETYLPYTSCSPDDIWKWDRFIFCLNPQYNIHEELSKTVSELNDSSYITVVPKLEQGGIAASGLYNTRTDRYRTIDFIDLQKMHTFYTNTRCFVDCYDRNKNFICSYNKNKQISIGYFTFYQDLAYVATITNDSVKDYGDPHGSIRYIKCTIPADSDTINDVDMWYTTPISGIVEMNNANIASITDDIEELKGMHDDPLNYVSCEIVHRSVNSISGGSGGCIVKHGDRYEYWSFLVSPDTDDGTYGQCYQYLINQNTLEPTLIKTINHNLGHVNSISYCEETDTLICGNGSGSYNLAGSFFIIENAYARTQLLRSQVIETPATTFGYKVNVVWGEKYFQNNIAYMLTKDGHSVRRILLGYGDNELELGTKASSYTYFNGTYKVLEEYEWGDPNLYNSGDYDQCVQGATFYKDRIVWGISHTKGRVSIRSARIMQNNALTKGSLDIKGVIMYAFNADGSRETCYPQGVGVYKDMLCISNAGRLVFCYPNL